MGVETERKFKVTGPFFKDVLSVRTIKQGYLCTDPERTVRVRISGHEAFLTVKGPSGDTGWSRYEFEQAIPTAEAEELLALCLPTTIDKVRHYAQVGRHVWEVDVFHGENEGLVIAEIELASDDEDFVLPDWAGEEVTRDKRYYNAMLSQKPYSIWNERNESLNNKAL